MGDHVAYCAAWLLAASSPTYNPGLGQILLSAAGPHAALHMCRITRCLTYTIRIAMNYGRPPASTDHAHHSSTHCVWHTWYSTQVSASQGWRRIVKASICCHASNLFQAILLAD